MEKNSQYRYLSKAEKNSIDLIDVDMMLSLLEHGDVILFGRVLGVLASIAQHNEVLNADQKRVLNLPKDLLDITNRLIHKEYETK